jgi:hypothetical protein
MSTLSSKINARRMEAGTAATDRAGLTRLPSPAEVAAIGAAQAHGVLVWSAVVAGLSSFRPEHLPAMTASWVAAAYWAGLAAWTATVFAPAHVTDVPAKA